MQAWYSSPSICCRPELNPGQDCLSGSCQDPDPSPSLRLMLAVIKTDRVLTQAFLSFLFLSLFLSNLHFYLASCCFSFRFNSPRLHPCLSFIPLYRSRAGVVVRQPHRHPSGFATSFRVHPAAQQPGECHRAGLPPQPRAGFLV